MKPSEESLRIKTKPPRAVKVDNLKTKETLYKMDSFHEFWELENWLQYKTINDRYSVNIYLNQECYELIDNDTQENLGEYYSMKVDDLLTEIAEKGKEIE